MAGILRETQRPCSYLLALFVEVVRLTLFATRYHKYARVGVKVALEELYFDLNKNLWAPLTCALGATNLCLRYAPAKCGKFDVSQCFFQFRYRYLEI